MQRLILFRYHKNFRLCELNLKLLRKLNPNCKIAGMYGGKDPKIPKYFLKQLDYNYILPFTDKKYKWLNGDLCILDWFKNQGENISFDVLNVYEWDMLFLTSMDNLYKNDKEDFAITEIFSYQKALEMNWLWIVDGLWKLEWEKQVKEAENVFGKIDLNKLFFTIMGGIQIPKSFLEKYSKLSPTNYINDEARICLYIYALKYEFKPNLILSNKNNIFVADNYDKLDFNFYKQRVKLGANAFHPVRDLELMKEIIDLTKKETNEI